MISIIITAYREPATIQKAIISFAEQKIKDKREILVLAPDQETLNEAKKLTNRYKFLKIIKDSGKGKPAALNLAVSMAIGDILVLSDGDVYVGPRSLNPLISYFDDSKIGAVSGKPVSVNPRNNMYGFWSHWLTSVADGIRTKSSKEGKGFFCSGYLFAIRKELFPKLHEELLSEDGYISCKVLEQGYRLTYSPNSLVYVVFPSTFKDWVKQKKRSVGGYNQIKKLLGYTPRSFIQESTGGIFDFFKYIRNSKELFWLVSLFFARIYLWFAIYRDVNIRKKSREELWLRVESTK